MPDGTRKKEQGFPIFRYYRVFNWEQTENVPEKTINRLHHDPIAACEEWFDSLTVSPNIKTDDVHNPHYNPARDVIHLPHIGRFDAPGDYYKTRAHETIHWTGHPSRLSRLSTTEIPTEEERAYEELVAELGAAMFAAEVGLEDTEDCSAAYIRSWLVPLQNNPRMIIKAASAATKAIRYLTKEQGVTPSSPSSVPQEALA